MKAFLKITIGNPDLVGRCSWKLGARTCLIIAHGNQVPIPWLCPTMQNEYLVPGLIAQLSWIIHSEAVECRFSICFRIVLALSALIAEEYEAERTDLVCFRELKKVFMFPQMPEKDAMRSSVASSSSSKVIWRGLNVNKGNGF